MTLYALAVSFSSYFSLVKSIFSLETLLVGSCDLLGFDENRLFNNCKVIQQWLKYRIVNCLLNRTFHQISSSSLA